MNTQGTWDTAGSLPLSGKFLLCLCSLFCVIKRVLLSSLVLVSSGVP